MKCRTCLSTTKKNRYSLQKSLSIGMTIKEMLQLFIPEMVKYDSIKDLICGDCMKAIKAFVGFIDRVIATEKVLKSEEFGFIDVTEKENSSSTKLEDSSNVAINIFNGDWTNQNSVSVSILDDFPNKQAEPTQKIVQSHSSGIPEVSISAPMKSLAESDDVIQKQELDEDETLIVICSEDTATAEAHYPAITVRSIEEINNLQVKSRESYIPTLLPSMISTERVAQHNSIISISTTNKATVDFFDKYFGLNEILPSLENKRILLLGDMLHECPQCKAVFTSNIGVRVHFNRAHPGATYPDVEPKKECNCLVCGALFSTGSSLNKHITDSHKDYCPYTCDKCGLKFKKRTTYKTHLKNSEYYQSCDVQKCYICQEVFPKETIGAHYKTHKNIQCVQCSKIFLTEHHYSKHLESHQINTNRYKTGRVKPRELLCPLCGKLFDSTTNWRTHLESHSQNRNYQCDKCPKAFKTLGALKTHLNIVHVSANHQCNTCGKITKTAKALEDHRILKHTDNYKHVCHICNAGFKRGDYYRRHLQKHTGYNRGYNATAVRGQKKYRFRSDKICEVPLPCKYCNSKFRYIEQLRMHLLKTHLMIDTRFKCGYCDMTFFSKENKKRHEKRHADPKSFELTCEVCHCRFKTKTELEVHSAKHKASMKYTCDLCEEKFPSKYLMMNHKRYKHFNPEIFEKQKVSLLAEGLKEYTLEYDLSTEEEEDKLKGEFLTSLKKNLPIGVTIQEMLLLFIPEMVPSETVKDYICGACMKTIQAFIDFIEKLIIVENHIRLKEAIFTEKCFANIVKTRPIVNSLENQSNSKRNSTQEENSVDTISNELEIEEANHTTRPDELEDIILEIDSDQSDSYSAITVLSRHNAEVEKCPSKNKDSAQHEDMDIVDLTDECLGTEILATPKASSDTVIIHDHTKKNLSLSIDDINHPESCVTSSRASITTIIPSMIPSNPVTNHDTVVSIPAASKDINGFLERISRFKNNLPRRWFRGNRRVLLFGNVIHHCPLCRLIFPSKPDLKTHFRRVHPRQEYTERDEDCDTNVGQEVLNDKPEDGFQCVVCSKKYVSEYQYNKHLIGHQNEIDRRLCPVCGKVFMDKSNFRQHLETHSRTRNYMCHRCAKTFKSFSHLKHHFKTHTEDRRYQCTVCGMLMKSSQGLEGHQLLKHSDTCTHVCHVCGATFKRADYYRKHVESHTEPNSGTNPTIRRTKGHKKYIFRSDKISEVPLPCKYCNKKFRYIDELRGHLLRMHLTGSAKYKCQHCHMSFSTKESQNRHQKRHEDPAAFELTCKVCYKRYDTKKELEMHSPMHKLTRRKCDLCQEIFPSKYLLMNHKRYKHFNPEVNEKDKVNLLADGLSDYTLGLEK
ncbi:hypothetical protein NQ315_013237 [Exocentrus adspersus]|uniref:Uncharacterized protein n=1 Tax=Exocentrus adspersus TaxID=1586481 RepID=A0AAV8V815_9CUCU|nr:hypothetical protein NQ315_013237 [Exocentrus adspersus]